MKDSENYKYLWGLFPGDTITNRYENLLIQVQEVLDKLEIVEKVHISTDLLELSVLDYFEDIARLKNFQNIGRVNVDKIYSYGAYWFLRRKPIQIIDTSLEVAHVHINEKVCVAITMSKMMAEMKIDPACETQRVENFLHLLNYNFKYRTYTQQSLELMIEAFFCGCTCFLSKESE